MRGGSTGKVYKQKETQKAVDSHYGISALTEHNTTPSRSDLAPSKPTESPMSFLTLVDENEDPVLISAWQCTVWNTVSFLNSFFLPKTRERRLARIWEETSETCHATNYLSKHTLRALEKNTFYRCLCVCVCLCMWACLCVQVTTTPKKGLWQQ